MTCTATLRITADAEPAADMRPKARLHRALVATGAGDPAPIMSVCSERSRTRNRLRPLWRGRLARVAQCPLTGLYVEGQRPWHLHLAAGRLPGVTAHCDGTIAIARGAGRQYRKVVKCLQRCPLGGRRTACRPPSRAADQGYELAPPHLQTTVN
jgi:hypothetical protein